MWYGLLLLKFQFTSDQEKLLFQGFSALFIAFIQKKTLLGVPLKKIIWSSSSLLKSSHRQTFAHDNSPAIMQIKIRIEQREPIKVGV